MDQPHTKKTKRKDAYICPPASKTPAKQRVTKVSDVVHTVCRLAFSHGLDHPSLETLVRIVTQKTELDQSSTTALIKNLYPAQRVADGVVVKVVGALGQGKGKPSPASQNALVRWLVTVYEVLEDQKVLSRLYGVLFGLLDMISLR